MRAVEEYQKRHDVRFPTATDYLRVAKELGYEKRASHQVIGESA